MTILYLDVNCLCHFYPAAQKRGAGVGASPAIIPYFAAARTGSASRARFSDA